MQSITRDGVRLAYEEIALHGTDQNSPSMLYVHGWGCDHTAFAPQVRFFGRLHRVVSVDLRGHGESDAPEQDYTMAAYADDLAWLCMKLEIRKPMVIGHSMGGNVALELAAHHPDVPASIVMVDSVVFPSREFQALLQTVSDGLHGSDYFSVAQSLLRSTCHSWDEEPAKSELLSSLPKAPPHVLISALRNHGIEYDATPAAKGCHLPVAYVGATNSLADLPRFRALTPQLVTAQTLGAGHFSQLFVPDQVNAMIARFALVTGNN